MRSEGAHLHCASVRSAGRKLTMSQRASPPSLPHSIADAGRVCEEGERDERRLFRSLPPLAPFRHSCVGRNLGSPTPPPPFPNSSLPPSRGEVRWGVGRCEPPPPVPHAPIAHPLPLPVIPAPLPVIPAQAGIQAISSVRCAPQHPDGSPKPPLRRRTFKAKTRDAHHAGSCLRRNDGRVGDSGVQGFFFRGDQG